MLNTGKIINLTIISYIATASETNNDYFSLERAEDNLNFNEIINYAGAGNSNSQITYNVFDNNPINGIYFIRISSVNEIFNHKFYRWFICVIKYS